MSDQERTDLFLMGAFAAIVLSVVALNLGYAVAMFVSVFAFFFFVYLWLTSGLEETNGDSTSV